MTGAAPKIAKPRLLGAIAITTALAMLSACVALLGLSAARDALQGTSPSSVADAH